jgi:hypothetical protein
MRSGPTLCHATSQNPQDSQIGMSVIQAPKGVWHAPIRFDRCFGQYCRPNDSHSYARARTYTQGKFVAWLIGAQETHSNPTRLTKSKCRARTSLLRRSYGYNEKGCACGKRHERCGTTPLHDFYGASRIVINPIAPPTTNSEGEQGAIARIC